MRGRKGSFAMIDRFLDWCGTDAARRTLFVMTVVLMGLLVANAVANISALAWASAVVLVVTFLLAVCVTVKPGGWYDRKR